MNMKRIIVSALAVMFAFAFSGSAYAANEVCDGAFKLVDSGGCDTKGTRDPVHSFKGSKNVFAYYSAGDGLDYTIATYHFSGDKTYGSSSFDQKLFTFDGKAKVPPSAPKDGIADPDFDGAAWTSL